MKNTEDAFYDLAPELVDIGVDKEGKREYASRRFIFMDANVFAKIFDDMEDVAGPVIRGQIKNFGETAGEKIGKKMDQSFEESSTSSTLGLLWNTRFDYLNVKAIKPVDNESQFRKILGYGRFAGWMGKTEIHEYEDGERLEISAKNTFESYSYGRTGRKECKFMTGVLEGLMHHFWDREVEAEEVECSCESFDSDGCVFEVETDES